MTKQKMYEQVLKAIKKEIEHDKAKGYSAEYVSRDLEKAKKLGANFPQKSEDLKSVDVKFKAIYLRHELKNAFPDVKFRVKISRYSGGSSLDVYYTDGPSTKYVDEIVKKYEYVYDSDPYQDYHNNDNYAFSQRSLSNYEEKIEEAKKEIEESWTGLDKYEIERKAYTLLHDRSYDAGAKQRAKEEAEQKKKEDEEYERQRIKEEKEAKEAHKKYEEEKRKRRENSSIPWFEGYFESSLHSKVELEFSKAKEAVKIIHSYNDFDAEKVNKFLDKIDQILPRKQYGEGNPNNGKRDFKISVGREGSVVIYLEATLKKQYDPKELAEKIEEAGKEAKVDEFDYEVKDSYYAPDGEKELTIRLWWD